MENIDVNHSEQDALSQLQKTLDALSSDQDKLEAGVIKLHNRNRNIHQIEIEYSSAIQSEILRKKRGNRIGPGPGEYSQKSLFGTVAGGKINPLPKNTPPKPNDDEELRRSVGDVNGIARGYRATKKRVTGVAFGQIPTVNTYPSKKEEFNKLLKSFFGTSKRSDINRVLLVSKLGEKVLHPSTSGKLMLKGTIEKAHPSAVFSVNIVGKYLIFKASRCRHLNCKAKVVECTRLAANRHGSEFILEKIEGEKKYCRLQNEFGLYLTAKSDGTIVCEALIDETEPISEGGSSQCFYSVAYTSDGNSYDVSHDLVKPRVTGTVPFGTPNTSRNAAKVSDNKVLTPRTGKSHEKGLMPSKLYNNKGFEHVERKAPGVAFGKSSRFGSKRSPSEDPFDSLKGPKLLGWFKDSIERKVYLKLKSGSYLKFDRPGSVKVVSKENADQECVVSFCHIQGDEFAIRNIHRDYVVCLAKSSSSNEVVTDTNVVVKKDKECNENEIGFLIETKGSRIALRSVVCGRYLAITNNDNELVATDKQSMAMHFTPVPYAPMYKPNDSIIRPAIRCGKWKTPKSKDRRGSTHENQASPALSTRSGIDTPSIGAPTPGGNASLLGEDGDEPIDFEPAVAQNITPQRNTPIDNFIRPRVLGGTWAPAPSTGDSNGKGNKRKRNDVPGPGSYDIERGIKKLAEKSSNTIIAPPAIKRTKNESRVLRKHRQKLQRESNSAGPGMYDIDRAAEVLRHGPNTFAEKKRPTFSRTPRGIISPKKGKVKERKNFSTEESKYSEEYLRNEEIIADNSAWNDGEISAMLQKPDLNVAYLKPRVKGGAWTHKSKKATWKNYHALKQSKREKNKIKSIGHYNVKHDGVERKVTGAPLLEKAVKSRADTRKHVKKATLNRKLKEHFEEAIRTYVDDLPEKDEFLSVQLHEDWAEKDITKPVFKYKTEEPLPSPVARLKVERERELRGPEDFIGKQSLVDWREQIQKRDNGLQSSLLDMSKNRGRDKVKVKQPGVQKIERFADPPKMGTDSFGPGHYSNVDKQYEAIKKRKPGSKTHISFSKSIGRKEAFGPFGEKPDAVMDEDRNLELDYGLGGDGEIIDLEPPTNRPNQKDNRKSFTWSKLPRNLVGNKEANTSDTNKLILDPNIDWGKKGRDVNKPTTKLKYEPFSKQTGRPAYSQREGRSDGTERYGDGYDMDYGDEGDIVDIDPRLTPVEKRVKTAKISSRPRWKTETPSNDIYDRGSEDGQNLILSPNENPAKARTDRHTVDFTKQQPRWATDVLDFDADGDMAFAPTDNATNVVYDIERGREALQGDISRGNVGVTWSMQKPRFTPKQKRDVLMDNYAGDSPKLILSPKEHAQSTVKPVQRGVAMSRSRPRWRAEEKLDAFELPNDGEGLILKSASEREAFQQPRVQSATSLEKSQPRWLATTRKHSVNEIDHSDIRDGEALILEPSRSAVEKKEAPTVEMDRQRGRSEPANVGGEKFDTSDLVYSPNVDFGRRNTKPMVRSVREVERQRRKDLENKIKSTEGLSSKEKKKMRMNLKQKFLKENLKQKLREPWSKAPMPKASNTNLKTKKDDIYGLNLGMEELILSPNTAKEKLNAKTKRGIDMLKQGISRSKEVMKKYDGGMDNIPMSVKLDDKAYVNEKPKTPRIKEKFMMKEDLTGKIAPPKSTFARKLSSSQKPPKVAGKLKIGKKLSKTLIGGIRKLKKNKAGEKLSKTIAPVQKTKAEIIRDQMLSLQFENDDGDWE